MRLTRTVEDAVSGARRAVTVCTEELREVKRMVDMYLVTGATGFLGRTIVEELVRRGSSVRALVLHGDPCTKLLPPERKGLPGSVLRGSR